MNWLTTLCVGYSVGAFAGLLISVSELATERHTLSARDKEVYWAIILSWIASTAYIIYRFVTAP